MKVFKTKWFRRFARREGISDETLCDAVRRAERGKIDANLGGGVIKQRIARKGQGRSGGYRSVIVYRGEDRAIFVFGFAKSDREDLKPDELKDLRKLAILLLAYDADQVEKAVVKGELWEVRCDGQALQE